MLRRKNLLYGIEMASYITKKKRDSRIEIISASCVNKKFKGGYHRPIHKQQKRFDIGDACYIDYVYGDGSDDLGYDWLEKEYGIGK